MTVTNLSHYEEKNAFLRADKMIRFWKELHHHPLSIIVRSTYQLHQKPNYPWYDSRWPIFIQSSAIDSICNEMPTTVTPVIELSERAFHKCSNSWSTKAPPHSFEQGVQLIGPSPWLLSISTRHSPLFHLLKRVKASKDSFLRALTLSSASLSTSRFLRSTFFSSTLGSSSYLRL